MPLHLSKQTAQQTQQMREYVDSKGIRCPICANPDIEGHFIETGEGVATQDMSCGKCDAEWIDNYTLASITLIIRE